MVVRQPTLMRGYWCLILGLFTQAQSSTLQVTGTVGQNVTLPCHYVKESGTDLDFCWGRGPLPTFKCSDTILSFVSGDVAFLSNHGYRVPRRGSAGDASLTIINAQMSNAGVYGCRVEVPGWFNDYKVNMELLMEEAPTPTQAYARPEQEFSSTEIVMLGIDESANVSAVVSTEALFKSLLQDGNIGRVAALFFVSSMVILVLIFRRRFLRTQSLERPDSSPLENIYENGPWTDGGYESTNI